MNIQPDSTFNICIDVTILELLRTGIGNFHTITLGILKLRAFMTFTKISRLLTPSSRSSIFTDSHYAINIRHTTISISGSKYAKWKCFWRFKINIFSTIKISPGSVPGLMRCVGILYLFHPRTQEIFLKIGYLWELLWMGCLNYWWTSNFFGNIRASWTLAPII